MPSDRRWGLLDDSAPAIVAALADCGVVKVDFIAAFDLWDRFSTWLCTSTDAERDALGTTNPAIEQVREVLLASGFKGPELRELVTVSQSQETVERDYEGSWFYAMR